MPRLTEKKKNFVREYALDFNGAKAWMRANNTDNYTSATVQASRVLREPEVQEYLQEYLEGILGPHEKRIKDNILFWQEIRDNPESRTADRIKASENIAKYAQMFTEKREIEHSGKVQIVDDIK
jgi:phage terminase small subunit